MNPFALIALQSRLASLAMEAQIVMSLRLLAMTGAIPARHGENERMIAEKSPAFARAAEAGTRAAMQGKSPDQILQAAMAPLSRKVSANRRRLMK